MNNFLCIGHRGASGYEPENTLSSFEKALELGCHWIELDVYAVEDELLVIHDDSVERTTNGKGNIMDSDLTYLRSLDAGNGQKIPTLKEVTDLVDKRCGINIELKGPDTAEPVSTFLQKLCRSGWDKEQFLISSFYHDELAKSDGIFRRGALFYKKVTDYFERTDRLGAYSINLPLKLAKRPLVEKAQDYGLKVFVYTVNKPLDIKRMINIGVDGVFCDFPDRVVAML